MKEFKKWEGSHSPGKYAYQKWEEGWRAALKWVLSTACKTKHGMPANSIQKSVIEKELEDIT